ncbi:Avt3p KNAG_0H02330 [Huiozyma naganishii CBS 8797]|uniref:Amino acid transporter transmembrane domain-containing protein n=1 Tax=Huiozyma naganishii (strain ATCC MYA-139 / BCRC 22969 / CBS 8797 / KCTC 17520 / NBRC 10181 / NCYC 3082 / Yp74L-3) TaxID=1071383 RepID=J7S1U5_HUIN7|nr:hypothetical protein KNAG_0H02330 [Kazachstania naganishii CBS 8797]CCK71647.1 hypothetical protein KNAG_0H02330 [Kazachstania naganishii CBS 8797]
MPSLTVDDATKGKSPMGSIEDLVPGATPGASILGPGQTKSRAGSNTVDLANPDPSAVDVVARHLGDSSKSLQMPGGDITRDLYKWTNDNALPAMTTGDSAGHSPQNIMRDARRKRSMSFSALSTNSGALNSMVTPSNSRKPSIDVQQGQIPSVLMTPQEIRAPGGFRRAYLVRKRKKDNVEESPPSFITRNFYEFLVLYGHFAGEDLSESESEEEGEERIDEEVIESENEGTPLVATRSTSERHKTTTVKAVLLLLKSFVGTGVLFLPKAFSNGGWGFSSLCLLFCAILSYYCFVLLIITKDKVGVKGYGEIGMKLYGGKMKLAILLSVALSQIGFAAAYTVFTATNLKLFMDNVFNLSEDVLGLGWFIWLQAAIFIPLSLTRNIAKLSGTALVADLFILLGLIYVYYYATYYVISNGVATSTMVWFNKSDWTLFIGTAIFTFEGIGLLIPIQESMKHPEVFRKSLSGVMVIVTVIFISCGLLCYSAFGSHVDTVVLVNFPQDSYTTAIVQLLYALAILLSTPLQLFPAIRILEQWTFNSNASGKHNPRVKWLKNYFRCGVVIFTTVLAWVGASDLDKFVSLVGSLACIPLIYIHPPLLHHRASRSDGTSSRGILILDLLICIFGFSVMVYTSWQAITLWIFG